MKLLFALVFTCASTGLVRSESPAPIKLPDLPVGVSSFGAVAADGYLYVYGGHSGKTHSYDTQTVVGTFQRVALDGKAATWEPLPGGPGLQGLNLASYRGKVLRVGGMMPRNAPGTPADNVSVATVASFDPTTKTWTALPDLPAPRSSHDVAVVGSKLYVLGGWQMKGQGERPTWHNDAVMLDLDQPEQGWKSMKQPFQRRALTVAVLGTRIYVLGGMTAEGAERTVDIYDTALGTWSQGPDIPGSERVGFSPSATVVNDRLILNTSAGLLARLTEDGKGWEKIGMSSIRRMVARLVPHGSDAVVLIGGAGQGGNVAQLEALTIPLKGEWIEPK